MLFIFRKLRRSFFLPGKVRTYCAYAVGEIALIMIGILLALQVSDWNQGRKDRAEEHRMLLAVLNEFRDNKANIDRGRAFNRAIQTTENQLLELCAKDEQDISVEAFDKLLADFNWYWSKRPISTSALNSVLLSGNFHLLRNEELRLELASLPELIEFVTETEKGDKTKWHNDYAPFMRQHAYNAQIIPLSTNEPGSTRPIPSLIVPKRTNIVDHRAILKNLTFQNLVLERWVVHWDILDAYDQFEQQLDRTIDSLEKEIEKWQ